VQNDPLANLTSRGEIPIVAAPPTIPHRDFVPWRFSDAGRRSAWLVSWVPASENLRSTGLTQRSKHAFSGIRDRDSLARQARRIIHAAARFHRSDWWRGGVAGGGAGAAADVAGDRFPRPKVTGSSPVWTTN